MTKTTTYLLIILINIIQISCTPSATVTPDEQATIDIQGEWKVNQIRTDGLVNVPFYATYTNYSNHIQTLNFINTSGTSGSTYLKDSDLDIPNTTVLNTFWYSDTTNFSIHSNGVNITITDYNGPGNDTNFEIVNLTNTILVLKTTFNGSTVEMDCTKL